MEPDSLHKSGWFRLCATRAGFHPTEWTGAEQFRIMMGLNREKSTHICLVWPAAQKHFMPQKEEVFIIKKKDKHLINKAPVLSSDTSHSSILRKGRFITWFDFSQGFNHPFGTKFCYKSISCASTRSLFPQSLRATVQVYQTETRAISTSACQLPSKCVCISQSWSFHCSRQPQFVEADNLHCLLIVKRAPVAG